MVACMHLTERRAGAVTYLTTRSLFLVLVAGTNQHDLRWLGVETRTCGRLYSRLGVTTRAHKTESSATRKVGARYVI